MANNYVYMLDGAAYVNLTNACHNACSFCIRNTGDGVAGTPLWLDKTPTADDVLRAFDGIKEQKKNEVVFCGYGEPTENLDALIGVARELKKRGYRTRLNTNGLGSLANGRDIVPELVGLIDVASVSLNSCTAEKYYEITRSAYGLDAFGAMLDFAKKSAASGIDTVFTVVDVIGEDDVAACKALAFSLGIPLRVRTYISDNYNG